MKILVHNPKTSRKRKHIARKTASGWAALRNSSLHYGDETSEGAWDIEDGKLVDITCYACRCVNEKIDNPSEPRPPLPCTEPDKPVTLWTRQGDDRALVHSLSSFFEKKSRCGVKNPSYALERWTASEGQPARLITCKFCLRAEGLLEGEQARRVRPRPKSSAAKQMWLDRWHAMTGSYHHSDPRAAAR